MKKRTQKALSMILSAALIMGTFTGCMGNGAAQTDPGTSEGKPDVNTIVPAKDINYYGLATGVTTEEYNAHPLANRIREYTGYNVTYDQVPTGEEEARTAINNIFINRENYQAIIVSRDQYYSLLAQDALKDLSPYINKTTNMKTNISELGWKSVSQDEGIYAIPRKEGVKATNWAIAFRADWLEEYNAANPENAIPVPDEQNGYSMSVSDFARMLEVFQTKVPQGGSAFHVDMNAVVQENIMPAFGIYGIWSDVDDKLTYYVDHPNFEAYLTYMQGLYDAGLVSYSATAEEANVVKMMQAGQLGAGRVFHWNATAIEKPDQEDDRIGYIAALVSDENKGDVSKLRQFSIDAYIYFTVVPKYSTEEQAAAVVDWVDKMLDEEFFRNLTIGEEGRTYTVNEEGYWPILPAFNDERGMADRFLIATREAEYAKYWLCRTRKAPAQNKLFSRINAHIKTSGYSSPIDMMPLNEVYDTMFSAAKRELDIALVTTMFGQTRMSVQQLRDMFASYGGAEITESVNTWYQNWEFKDSYNTVK